MGQMPKRPVLMLAFGGVLSILSVLNEGFGWIGHSTG